jgi:hypothetical protein
MRSSLLRPQGLGGTGPRFPVPNIPNSAWADTEARGQRVAPTPQKDTAHTRFLLRVSGIALKTEFQLVNFDGLLFGEHLDLDVQVRFISGSPHLLTMLYV